MLSKSGILNIIVFSPSKVSLKIDFQNHQKKDSIVEMLYNPVL